MNSIAKCTKQNKRYLGTVYEEISRAYIEKLGYTTLKMNYRCRLGEIDIIAQDGKYLVFLEIKYRSSRKCGLPRESVNYYKQKRILNVAKYYIMTHYNKEVACRFDVIEILGEDITHLKNVF